MFAIIKLLKLFIQNEFFVLLNMKKYKEKIN